MDFSASPEYNLLNTRAPGDTHIGRSTTPGITLGYIYCIVAVTAYAVLGLSYKISDHKKCDQSQVNFFLFLFAAIIVLIWGLARGVTIAPVTAVILGVADGVIVFASVLVFRRAAALGRISTSWTILNLSLVIPVIASVAFWHEIPSARHYAGFGLTLVAIVLLGIDAGRAGE